MHKKKLESLFFTYLEVSLERIKVGIDTTSFTIFLILTWGLAYFLKEGAAEKRGVDFDLGGWGTYGTLVLRVEDNLLQGLPDFLFLVTWKE